MTLTVDSVQRNISPKVGPSRENPGSTVGPGHLPNDLWRKFIH
jgi:hypothetical protein